MMKTRIHINKQILGRNRKRLTENPDAKLEPCITAKTYKDNRYGFRANILDKEGNVVASVVYAFDPNEPRKQLSCGAVAWVETDLDVEVETVTKKL